MKKLFLTLLMMLLIIMSTLPTANAVYVDDAVYLKQASGSKQCTLVSNVMMLRRRAYLENDPNWTSITTESVGNIAWGSGGMSFEYTYNGKKVYSYGVKSELGLSLGDVNAKKQYLIENLITHPEGIVIYVHHNSSYLHAVLLTDYDSSTDTFYCADPAPSISSGRIPLDQSLLPKYVKVSYPNTGLADQDLVIGYIQQTWMIIEGSGVITPSAVQQYLDQCTSEPCNVILTVTTAGNMKTMPCSADTNAQSATVEALALGHTYSSTVRWRNTAGNTWYEAISTTGQRGFIYSGDVSVSNPISTLSISGQEAGTPSGSLTQGSSFGLRGVISSNYPITYVEAHVFNADGTDALPFYSTEWNKTEYNIRYDGINNHFSFKNLPVGNYHYVVKATNSSGETKTLIDSYFTIGGGVATYTVSYNANGGTGAPGNQTKTQGTALRLSSTVPTRTGYTFKGWSTSNGGGAEYQPGGRSYTTDAGVTLYAVWDVNYYTFDLNGYLDGITNGGMGVYGTCDIYMNGSCIAEGVDDYCADWPYGTSYEIKNIRARAGRQYDGVHSGSLSGTVGSDRTEVYLSFSTIYYDLDVNGLLDGVEAWDINNYGVVDVYINGNLVLSGCSDFSNAIGSGKWPYGTTYEIRNIQPAEGYSYDGISNIAYDEYVAGGQSGTITDNTSVRLAFHSCPTSLDESPESAVFDGHTYYYFSTPVTWFDAKSICENMGGHLVTITSEEEDNFVFGFADGTLAWLGATDIEGEGNWNWITGEEFSYSNWYADNPDNYSENPENAENYLHYSGAGNGKWNDNAGCSLFPFVCEIDTANFNVYYFEESSGYLLTPEEKVYGEAWTISNQIPSKDGFYFLGWHLYDYELLTGSWDGHEINPERAVTFLPGEIVNPGKRVYMPGKEIEDCKVTYILTAVWSKPDLILPQALKEIDGEAFVGGAFRFVKLPENAVSIGWHAFADCPNLSHIYIPASVTDIDPQAFGNMTALTVIGERGSTAETFARAHGFTFLAG